MEFVRDEGVQLMLKFQGGDDSSFNALLDKYHAAIINFCYRFTGNKQEAEDLAQEVFLRIYRSRHNYKPQAKLSTWIYCIAKNLTLNALRQKANRKTSSLDEMVQAGDSDAKIEFADVASRSPSQKLEENELAGIVKEAIDSLPVNQRMAVVLRRYDGLAYEDIARIIGCSVSAVKSLLNRAKIALKEKLASYI